MGEVWAAHDEELRRRVAVKIVLAALGGDRGLIERLRHEALTAAALQHPGISVVHDIGESDGHPYVVMEFLDGRTFAELLDGHPRGLPVRESVEAMTPIAAGLEHAHGRGVVHRDIKPANLMLLTAGGAKILDFGIASYAEATTLLTPSGVVLGSAAYMPPEQWRGGQVTPAADMYAFGATLFTLLTGGPPFPGLTAAAWMHQHLDVGSGGGRGRGAAGVRPVRMRLRHAGCGRRRGCRRRAGPAVPWRRNVRPGRTPSSGRCCSCVQRCAAGQ